MERVAAHPAVDPQKIGVIGHSLGGHNSIFTAVFDPRLKVVVSSCGFCPFRSYMGGKGDGEWTTELSRKIGTLGQNLGWDVCASKNCDEQFDNGWLYDLTWFRNDPEGHLEEVGLVLESEWGRKPSEIKYDFEKLLVAKAPLKVMIFLRASLSLFAILICETSCPVGRVGMFPNGCHGEGG